MDPEEGVLPFLFVWGRLKVTFSRPSEKIRIIIQVRTKEKGPDSRIYFRRYLRLCEVGPKWSFRVSMQGLYFDIWSVFLYYAFKDKIWHQRLWISLTLNTFFSKSSSSKFQLQKCPVPRFSTLRVRSGLTRSLFIRTYMNLDLRRGRMDKRIWATSGNTS